MPRSNRSRPPADSAPTRGKKANGRRNSARKAGIFIGPPKPFRVVVEQELARVRVNIAFKTLSLRSVSGCNLAAGDHVEAIRRAAEHNLRDDAHHHVLPGAIKRERSHLNEILRGPSSVDVIEDIVRNTFAEFEIKPPREDSIVGIEIVLFPGQLADPCNYFAWAIAWIENLYGPVLSAVRHLDQSADHVHVLLLPIVDGKLKGGARASGEFMFEKMHVRFLIDAEAKFGLMVRGGHDRSAPAVGSRTVGSRRSATVGGRTVGSPVANDFLGQHPYLRKFEELHVYPLPLTCGFESAGDDYSGMTWKTAPPADATANTNDLSRELALARAEIARLTALYVPSPAQVAEKPPHANRRDTQVVRAARMVSCGKRNVAELPPYMVGKGFLSITDLMGLRIPGWNRAEKLEAALELLVQQGNAEFEDVKPLSGVGRRYRLTIDVAPAPVDTALAALRATEDAEMLRMLAGRDWSSAGSLVRMHVPGWLSGPKVKGALQRLIEAGQVDLRTERDARNVPRTEYRLTSVSQEIGTGV